MRWGPAHTEISAGSASGGRAPATTRLTRSPPGTATDASPSLQRNESPRPSRSGPWKPRRPATRSSSGLPTSTPVLAVAPSPRATRRTRNPIETSTTAVGTRPRVLSRVRRSMLASPASDSTSSGAFTENPP